MKMICANCGTEFDETEFSQSQDFLLNLYGEHVAHEFNVVKKWCYRCMRIDLEAHPGIKRKP